MLKEHRDEYDILRVLGTVLVVMGHSAYTTMLTATGGIEVDVSYAPLQSVILLFVRLIYSFHMPLFVALSGALFYLTQTSEQPFKLMVAKKAKRLLVPFLLTSALWAVPLKLLSGYWANSENPIHDIIVGQFVLFDNNHLWYVVSLFWIFCLFWIMCKITNNWVVIGFVCVACLIIAQFIPYNYFGIQRALSHAIWFWWGVYMKRIEQQYQNS